MDITTIRKKFIDFFKEKNHVRVDAVPIVNQQDPDLLFVNAGMNPFKDVFLGNKKPVDREIVNTQACLRVAGKHNDLEEVGVDTYHHTLFEMAGSWSFGSYFKKEIIGWAWELLTKVYAIDPKRLYITVFEGDKTQGLSEDIEAYNIWRSYLSQERILYGSKRDNFWEMASVGPCGPCTEIHVDCRSDELRSRIPGRSLVNKDDPEVVELWNIVFIEYNRNADGGLTPLPIKHVDTGMGLERLAMVLQGKKSTYETDIFSPIIEAIEQKANVSYGKDPHTDTALRVIADHLRAITFAIADGVIPSNQKAGYVVRRILRRALRFAYSYLDIKEPFLHELSPIVVHILGKAYPSLLNEHKLVSKIIYQEEVTFIKTLGQGIKRLRFITDNLSPGVTILPGQEVFELYDTYGFPPDLTRLILREKGLSINKEGFEKCMEEQRLRGRKDGGQKFGEWQILHDDLTPTFVGYDSLQVDTHLIKYRMVERKGIAYYQLVLNKTPFYPEGGGQVGDTGHIQVQGERVAVVDTQKENGVVIHYTKQLPKNLHTNFLCVVDKARRKAITANHTATHLMNAAMRKILGEHITQKGSFVDDTGLRFDFNHYEKIPSATLQQIERLVNKVIRDNLTLEELRNTPIKRAKQMGAVATFGEKYGERVRVIKYSDFSAELCGGTHVQATGQIGIFKIQAEKSISAGIRRLEALTSFEAESWISKEQEVLRQISLQLKRPQDIMKAVEQLISGHKALRQRLERLEGKVLSSLEDEITKKIISTSDIDVVVEQVEVESVESLRKLAIRLGHKKKKPYLVLATVLDKKVYLIVSTPRSQTTHHQANKIIQQLLDPIQGKGGGSPHFALASGSNLTGLEACLKLAKHILLKN